MKAFKVTYRYAVGYGANLRYIGLRRDFIVNAETKEEALDIVAFYNFRTFGTGLYRGWIRAITTYKGGKTTRTTQDFRHLQTV
jgi:hypothetical protein